MLLAGQGGDHLTSSAIYHDSATTCIPNTLVGNVGCFSSTITATGTIRSNDVNSYQLFQASNTTDTKLWSIQNLPTSGDFRIRAGNDAFTNGINGITISRTGISSVSVALGGNTTIENSGTFTVGSTAGTGTGILYASTACFASSVCVGGGLVAQQPSTFCDTVGLFGASPQLYIGATSGASDYTILKWCTTNKSLNIHNQSTVGNPQLVIACNGNVGVKTIAAPSYDLEVRGNIGVLSSTSAGLITTSTLCAAGAITGFVRFDGRHTPSLTTYTGPSINACKDDANYATSLVFKTTDGSGGNNVNLRITGAGVANFSSRVNINGAPDDADIAMVVKSPSGSGKFIMFGRNASDIAVFRISNTGETTANQFISCATDNGSGEYYFIKGNAAVSNNFSIYAYSNTLYYNSYSSMYFRANNTGGSGGDIIFSGGNVGIGTTSPGKIFNVAANDTTSGNYQARSAVIRIQNTNDVGANSRFAGVQFSFSPGASTGDNYVIGAVGAVLTDSSTQWSGDLVFAVKNATTATTLTEYMRIATGGNVGIGTTSPNNLLTLYSASSAIYTQWVQSGTGTSSTDGLRIGLDASSNGIINLNEGTALITSIDGTERMRITSTGIACFACQVCAPAAIFTGCVGIGITSPSYKLDVYSSTTATQNIANFAAANYGSPSSRTIIQIGTQYEDGSSRIASVNTTGNQSALIFQSHAATSGVWNDAMYITGGGEVGIGTTNPTYRLEVCGGSSQVSSFVKHINGDGINTSFVNLCSNGYSSYIYIGSAPGLDWKLGKNVLNTSTCTYFQIVDSSNNLRLQINADGNVGIGTASPAYKLDVNGNIGAGFYAGQCMTLSSWSSNSGLILNYGNASGQVTAINIQANGITNGYIGMQMVDSSNGDLWLGGASGRSITLYRTGNTGFKTNTPCTGVHVEGGYGSRWGGNSCFFGGGVSGGGFPYGDIYGNGASYTYQTACTTATSDALFGGYAAGYFKGGGGGNYGGGGAGVLAIGGDGANSEGVNSGGGAGIFARGGKNGAGSAHAYAGWFDGGDVIIRCGNVGIGTCAPNAKLTVWTSSTTGLQTALRLNNPFGFDNLNTGTQIVFSQDRSVAEDLKQGIIAVGQADAGTSATSFMAFYTNNTGLGERLRITSTGRVGILTNDPKGLFEVGMTCAKTTFGGFLFNTLSVADSNWFCFFQPPGNWAGLTTMNWVAPNDFNRSGAAQIRWSYQDCAADLGPRTSIFNDSQNATATFRYAGGWLQACISGAGAGYSVQFTIIGARGA
jgi:hypothetical protein